MEQKEYEDYMDVFHENQEFQDWTFIQKFEANEFNYKKYCCISIANQLFQSRDEDGEIKYHDVDVIINRWDDGTYGIPIHDGGSSIIEIEYCPWCGESLKNK